MRTVWKFMNLIPKSTLLLAVSCMSLLPVSALSRQVAVSEATVSFELPDRWEYRVASEPTRKIVAIRAGVRERGYVVFTCQIDRHDLPPNFRSYSQQQLNEAYAGKPLDAEGFRARLSTRVRGPLAIEKVGQRMIGGALAYWAIATVTEGEGAEQLRIATKHFVTQTPGFGWMIQCGAGSLDKSKDPMVFFKEMEKPFEEFVASIRFLP